MTQTYFRNLGAINLFFAKKLVVINKSLTDRPGTYIFCICLFTFVYTYVLNTESLKKLFSENLG